MKKIFIIFAALLMIASIFLPQQVSAQAPEKMSYQAVIRNSSDELVKNTQIGIKISILKASASGAAVYVETQTPTTNINGLASIEIGAGTVISGNFTTIDWANGPYFIKTETDPSGGTNYSITVTNQLLSVPYALHAKTSEGFMKVTQDERDALTPTEGLIVYNTTTKMPNYYNGTEWMLFNGGTAETLAIGDEYQGGIIAYILQPGDPGYFEGQTHGIIAAKQDHSSPATWGCLGTSISGAYGISLGTGWSNTINIVNECSTPGIAAEICLNLSIDGYNDWYLPSFDELFKLYESKDIIGGFIISAGTYYWSSSEQMQNTALSIDFFDGSSFGSPKHSSLVFRAVRSF